MNKLKEIRESKGMSQAEVCRQAKINISSYCCYEQGVKDIDNARLTTIVSICNVLECKITDILNNEELIKKCKAVKM